MSNGVEEAKVDQEGCEEKESGGTLRATLVGVKGEEKLKPKSCCNCEEGVAAKVG